MPEVHIHTQKKNLGYDHGFLSAWFLVLVYVVIIWANLTALALIGRNLLGDMFMFGFHYQIAGYDIYFGEILASVGVLLLCGAICVFRKRLAAWVQILMAVVLIGGIVVCFVAAAVKNGGGFSAYQLAFSTMSSSKNVVQIFSIVALMPWAYVGFESVSHSAEEFKFKFNKSFLIIFISLLTAGLAYILLNFLAVVVCDVNGLKIINDTLGHAEGDKFIRQACAIICEIFAHSPICRIGGDEFVAILRGRDYDDRHRLIEQLRKSNSNNAESGSAVIAFGMSEYERGADKSVDMVFHRADAAMYAEKKALKENNRE